MEIKLVRAAIKDVEELPTMQVAAFQELLEKYQDYDTNPANENVEKVEIRLKQDFTYYYFICLGTCKVGAVRVIDKQEDGKNKRISPLFILPEFQGQGIAQKAIQLCEELKGVRNSEIDFVNDKGKSTLANHAGIINQYGGIRRAFFEYGSFTI